MDLKQFKTDPTAELVGVWVDVDGTTKLKVARFGNDRYKADVRRRTAPHKRAIRNGTFPEDSLIPIMVEVMADTILLDWRGLQEGGVELPYTRANAVRILKDCAEFRDLVSGYASDLDTFKQTELDESIDSLKKDSPGS